MYQLLMQPPAGVDPGEGNGKTGTTSCQQAGASVNDLVRVGSNTTRTQSGTVRQAERVVFVI